MTTDPNPHEDWTPIVVAGPLPMDVAGTLMKLIVTAWPSAVIDTSGEHPGTRRMLLREHALVMLVNPKDRAKAVSKKKVAELKDHDDGTDSGEFLGFARDSLLMAAPEDLVLELGAMAHVIFEAMAGDNYIEWEVRTKVEGAADARYVLSIARSKGQMPHALRTRAEEELETLRAQVRALGDDFKARCPGDDEKHTKCLGARVHALLGE